MSFSDALQYNLDVISAEGKDGGGVEMLNLALVPNAAPVPSQSTGVYPSPASIPHPPLTTPH
ncbi:hypothetical protein CONPUDRAFT_153700 [Coniophora puteana RWD-64-598 SS2]|uniref:Uncharacterized protein n=1 Tax=Coniophora puteana (strain RWD-64-598) TaxID=741705 RepID=A0A5M3MQZ0_CONPW|nr:uncharacterized protein CONPUDRAFT_153700 [Coniophora puteana RWD-64-598 SS2]EIW81154.1 hypothetical protein CONPUDRAFT_153700 [Coniophora puteana RWD-64-598 SS2]